MIGFSLKLSDVYFERCYDDLSPCASLYAVVMSHVVDGMSNFDKGEFLRFCCVRYVRLQVMEIKTSFVGFIL